MGGFWVRAWEHGWGRGKGAQGCRRVLCVLVSGDRSVDSGCGMLGGGGRACRVSVVAEVIRAV